VRSIRRSLHELANVFTGVVIAAGLLEEYLEGGSLQEFASEISTNGERGSALVREIREHFLAACPVAEPIQDATTIPLREQ